MSDMDVSYWQDGGGRGLLSVYLFVCLSLSPLNTTLERNTVSLFAEVSGLSPDLLTDMDDGADLQGKY